MCVIIASFASERPHDLNLYVLVYLLLIVHLLFLYIVLLMLTVFLLTFIVYRTHLFFSADNYNTVHESSLWSVV